MKYSQLLSDLRGSIIDKGENPDDYMPKDSITIINRDKFVDICKSKIHREGIEKLLGWLDKSDFYQAPASTKYHGNYDGGLCQHSLNVYDQLLYLNEKYGVEKFTEETLAVTALFHDLCKVNFYIKKSRNVKEDGRWVSKEIWEIDEKVPLGHGEKSCIILQQFISLNLDELLAIRWHMGGFDNAVKGGDYSISKAQDMSKLVTLLSVADLISSSLLEEKL